MAAGREVKFALRGRIFFRFVMLLCVLAVSIASAKDHPARFVPGQILVKPRSGVAETTLATKFNAHGAKSRLTLRKLNVRVVNVSEQNVDAVLTALKSDPDIEYAERDYIAEAAFVPNDPYVGSEW